MFFMVPCLRLNGTAETDCSSLFSLLSSWRREGSIKLDDSTVADERGLPVEEYEDDSEDEDDMAPFSGYSHHAEKEGLRLPEKVDSKAGWI